jgi:hypothetical protein
MEISVGIQNRLLGSLGAADLTYLRRPLREIPIEQGENRQPRQPLCPARMNQSAAQFARELHHPADSAGHGISVRVSMSDVPVLLFVGPKAVRPARTGPRRAKLGESSQPSRLASVARVILFPPRCDAVHPSSSVPLKQTPPASWHLNRPPGSRSFQAKEWTMRYLEAQ